MYKKEGIDLVKYKIVGLGSVCRRQHTDEIAKIIRSLYDHGINLHAFGVKKSGLKKIRNFITSSDSMAWSFWARHDKPLKGCFHKHCGDCHKYAEKWYYDLLKEIEK